MCGIAGFFGGNFPAVVAEKILINSGKEVLHRGPDDFGVWFDAKARIGLSHRRLSILDLSKGGHQPMISASGRYIIVFNGEIYNHLELRFKFNASDEATEWRGNSDTETLLDCIDRFGIAETLRHVKGMFSFAVWDSCLQTLTIARDRLGEKPLYYGFLNDIFVFGSELKVFESFPGFKGEIDRISLAAYIDLGYIPTPRSIYKNILKLEQSSYLSIDNTLLLNAHLPTPLYYWNFSDVTNSRRVNPFVGSDLDMCTQLEELITHSVTSQKISDVPVGAFLSGGVDSSLLVALMQNNAQEKINTFTIGFDHRDFDEANHARVVATHLGTNHTELYVTEKELLGVIHRLPFIYDEPFADASQIPTILLSELARKHVKVAITGDGGDEIFGGYNRYLSAGKVWNLISLLPLRLRQIIFHNLGEANPGTINLILESLQCFLPERLRYPQAAEKYFKFMKILQSNSQLDLYKNLVTFSDNTEFLLNGYDNSLSRNLSYLNKFQELEFVEWMMAVDTVTYLADDILVKTDRASMSVGLETRAPFLDSSIIEFAWRLPLEMKIRNGHGKWALRQILYKYVPSALIDRKKTGFSVPIAEWLRGPLRDWAESLLSEECLRSDGYFDPIAIRSIWRQHLKGERNWGHRLWSILMFQAWNQRKNSLVFLNSI